jgi:formate dehydrogenase iron-sulfur subunit
MSTPIDNHTVRAILTDTTLCTGCETCVSACRQTYGLGRDRAWRWKSRIDDLSATRFCTIERRPGSHFVRKQCRHCNEPACASACIVGALQKKPEGPVIYDEKRCMGCRYCMMACPYGIPRYSWENNVPLVRKCILCYDRVKAGGQPACTEACPYKATIFGTRADMLAEAERRFAEKPGKYFAKPGKSRPEIWGEHEIGGTSVLYISDIDLSFLGWRPNLGDQPLPTLTWAALSKVPPLVVGVAGAMSAVYWIVGRRMKLAAEAAENARPPSPDEPEKLPKH